MSGRIMKKERKTIGSMDLLPAILLFTLLPVMSKGQLVTTGLSQYAWLSVGEQGYDFFMHWKSVIFLGLVVWMIAVLLDRILLRRKKVGSKRQFLPLAIYAVLVILSTVFSVNQELSLHGMLEQYETIWVLLGYLLTAFYCAQVAETKRDVQILLGALCVGALLQGLIGLSQAAGMDFWNTALGKSLLTLGLDASVKEKLVFSFGNSDANKVYMASYNPNYAGVYIILTLPLVLTFAAMAKKKWQKIAALVVAVILTICLVACGSKMGILVAGVLVVLGGWMLGGAKKSGVVSKKDSWKRPVCMAGCLFAAVLGILVYDAAGNHRLTKAIAKSVQKKEYKFTELEPGQDSVRVTFKGNTFELSAEHTEQGDTLKVIQDGERLPVYWDMDRQRFFIEKEGYEGMSFDAFVEDGISCVIIWRNKISWQFMKEGAEGYVYVNLYGKKDVIVEAETVLPGYEKALSGRGYIWGRTLPLLKDTLLWGTGPDTFTVVFPQNDYLYRAHTSRKLFTQIRSKAHNMYLQTALQTGVCSLICLVIFWCMLLKGLWRQRKQHLLLCTGLMLSLTGYLLMGFLNDSVVAVAPLFWGIAGVGVALSGIRE